MYEIYGCLYKTIKVPFIWVGHLIYILGNEWGSTRGLQRKTFTTEAHRIIHFYQ